MILTKTPLRISFVGGGSDRPSFYSEEPGACVAATIDKYVYVTVSGKYDGSIRAAYSQTENVSDVAMLQHELIREALKEAMVLDGGIEIHSIADVPGGTGLGSSSAFTAGLLAGLYTMNKIEYYGPQWLAHDACRVELDRCRKPIGKQDQYTAAYGGINLLGFTAQCVTVEPIMCDVEALSRHCLLLDTGLVRSGDAGQHLAAQQQDRDEVRELAMLARAFARALTEGKLVECGAILNDAWQIKRRFVSNDLINSWYYKARLLGAWGGKLCGAGGGGFLLFLAPPERHAAIISALRLRHVPIQLGVPGCQVVYS